MDAGEIGHGFMLDEEARNKWLLSLFRASLYETHAIEVEYLPTSSLVTLQVYRVTIDGRLQPFCYCRALSRRCSCVTGHVCSIPAYR